MCTLAQVRSSPARFSATCARWAAFVAEGRPGTVVGGGHVGDGATGGVRVLGVLGGLGAGGAGGPADAEPGFAVDPDPVVTAGPATAQPDTAVPPPAVLARVQGRPPSRWTRSVRLASVTAHPVVSVATEPVTPRAAASRATRAALVEHAIWYAGACAASVGNDAPRW